MSFFDRIVSAVTPAADAEDRAKAHAQARALTLPGDWLDQILDHHEQIEAAFDAAGAVRSADDRRKALETLEPLLAGHSIAEEAVVYPQLSHDHKTKMSMAYEEQQAAKVELALLEGLDPLSKDWEDKLGHLRGAVLTHVYQEESDLFPALHKELAASDQVRMTRRYGEEISRYGTGLKQTVPQPG